MSEYDSILKEKKKSQKTETIPKKFPKFLVSFVLIMIVLIISYIIYFNNILSPKNIIINDTLTILKKYSSLIKNIPFEEFKTENNIIGTIQYGSEKIDFNLIKNNNNLSFNILQNDKYINYYLVNSKAYVKVPSINEYVSLDKTFSINNLLSLQEKIATIEENKYLKTVYLDNEKTIVEINFLLNTTELNNLLGINLKDNYEILATFKNTAIMNDIYEIKIVINNITDKKRSVITINNNEILYKVNNDTYKIILETTNNDFIIKVSKNDVLYSVLSGTVIEDSYKYTYQIIDTVYNINIISSKNLDGYFYEIIKKKDELEEKMNIELKVEDSYLIESDAENFIDSSNGLIANTYNNDVNYFKDKFKNFLDIQDFLN